MGNDQMIVQAVGGGNLELSQFMPLVADCLLGSIDLLGSACDIFARHCVLGIEADVDRCSRNVDNSTALLTALIDRLGYDAAEEIAHAAAEPSNRQSIRELVIGRGMLTAEEFDGLTSPDRVTRLGS
jgi:aspartate ammonia-lyase